MKNLEVVRVELGRNPINWVFFFTGMLIVGFSTGWSIVPLLGAFIAAIHIDVKTDR